ncbi:MAG TPA: circadian clock KaiB family protein [Gemmatimonadaceae bacterium]|nr:circadian clock KaiB family protein [Gemmatimonadaceae bacterium]
MRFTLYIAGDTARSRRAVVNFRRLADQRFSGRYELRVVDVQRQPERAEEERILTTPTLVREEPEPRRRVTGDLTDAEQVMVALALGGEEEDNG